MDKASCPGSSPVRSQSHDNSDERLKVEGLGSLTVLPDKRMGQSIKGARDRALSRLKAEANAA